MEFVEINDCNRDAVLELFGLETDEDGYILRGGERVECPYEEKEVHKSNFAIVPAEEIDFLVIEPTKYSYSQHYTKEPFLT